MFYNDRRAMAHPDNWSDQPGGTKRPGMRLRRAGRWIFVPNDELLDLANDIADHLAGNTPARSYFPRQEETA